MVGVGHHDGHQLVAQAVTEYEGLRHEGRPHVHILNLLRRDILA